jgi:hypothetical protein
MLSSNDPVRPRAACAGGRKHCWSACPERGPAGREQTHARAAGSPAPNQPVPVHAQHGEVLEQVPQMVASRSIGVAST